MNMTMVSKAHLDRTWEGIPGGAGKARPEWAQGLRQIYDCVLHEPLPESVKALLGRLDKGPD